jgi:hypothetical protein
MKTIYLVVLLLYTVIFGCRKTANDEIILNFDEIQNKLSVAKDGDTIYIPTGTFTIKNSLIINKNIVLKGAGVDKTFINSLLTGIYTEVIIITTNNNAICRITGITFKGFTGTNHSYTLGISGSCKSLRIDNCKFQNGGDHSVFLDGDITGVIDHCEFIDDSQESILIRNSAKQDEIWEKQPLLGTDKAIFIEDCIFTFNEKGDHAITSINGQSYVFRHNIISSKKDRNATQIDTHGNYYNDRSGYSSEIYENTLLSEESWYGIYMRGGKGVIFNNTFSGLFYMPICFANDGSFLPTSGPPYHDDTYPAIDQINSFYVWDNKLNTLLISDGTPVLFVQNRGKEREHIQKNRDYLDCAMPGYMPFTYPHPLTLE